MTIVHQQWCDQRIRRDPLQKLQMPSSSDLTSVHHKHVNKLKLTRWKSVFTNHLQSDWRNGRCQKGMLDPEFEEKVIGEAVIRETLKVSKVGTIGGFMVLSVGYTWFKVRVIRDVVVIMTELLQAWNTSKMMSRDHKWSWRDWWLRLQRYQDRRYHWSSHHGRI